jgi:hypothetical protein
MINLLIVWNATFVWHCMPLIIGISIDESLNYLHYACLTNKRLGWALLLVIPMCCTADVRDIT